MPILSQREIKRPPTPEIPPMPESIPEREPIPEKEIKPAPTPIPQDIKQEPLLAKTPELILSSKSERLKKIETILGEGLEELYASMQPEQRKQFKEKGEITASKIQQLLTAVKVQAQKILELIKTWLRSIPRVNKFFLEQEAKIKTDKILALRETQNPKF